MTLPKMNSMESAPLNTRIQLYNPATGWWTSQSEDGRKWPKYGWDGLQGTWYPVPYGWLPAEKPND